MSRSGAALLSVLLPACISESHCLIAPGHINHKQPRSVHCPIASQTAHQLHPLLLLPLLLVVVTLSSRRGVFLIPVTALFDLETSLVLIGTDVSILPAIGPRQRHEKVCVENFWWVCPRSAERGAVEEQ
jgi:hypothetical protein